MSANIERLTLLSKFIETLKDADFDMTVWWSNNKGCPCGWACQIPSFKNEGLTLYKDKHPIYYNKARYPAIAWFFGLTERQAIVLFSSFYYKKLEPTRLEVLARLKEFIKVQEKSCLATNN